MRTITHGTGNNLYTVEMCDEAAYVFQPNMMRITLNGTNYSATQEVTLKVGSLSFKRTALNRIVYFDLTDIFKSAFAGSTFPIVYDVEQTDPFVDSISIIVSPIVGGAQDETISTDIIFGSLQPDESLISATPIQFPFWVGLPLCVNAKYFPQILVVNGTNTTGRKIVDVVETADFTYTQIGYSAETQQVIQYKVRDCPTEGWYIRWVDQRGQIWHYKFRKSDKEQFATTIKSGDKLYKTPTGFTDEILFSKGSAISKKITRQFKAYANENIDTFRIVETVAQSMFVALYLNSKWIEITVKDATTKSNGEFGSDIEFTFEMPENYSMEL